MDAVLTRAGLLAGIDPDDMPALTADFRLRELSRGETVFREGDPSDGLYIVLYGRVKLGTGVDSERHTLVDLMGPADLFGELSLVDPGPRTTTATAVTDTRLAWLPRETFERWLVEHPSVGRQLLRVLAGRVRRLDSTLADHVFVDVAGRVAKRLLEFAERFGTIYAGRLRVSHDLTQGELAQLVGSSRETVNKTLSDFVSRGWIEIEDRTVVIVDRERLRRRCR